MPWSFLLLASLACVGGTRDSAADTHADTEGDTDSVDPAPFTCGEHTCDARLEYCLEWTGGIPDTAGEAVVTFSCEPIPESCSTTPTCACLEAALGPGEVLTCEVVEGALFVGAAGA